MPLLFDKDRGGFRLNVINFEASTVVCSGRFALHLHQNSAHKTSTIAIINSNAVNLVVN